MILSQRQQRIQEILQGCKSMRVQALIDQLDASPATVRRELAVLESNGVLFRTRGEIHLAEPGKEVLPYSTRSTFHARAKKSIAQYAAELITDHKNLALDSGSTTAMLARVLSDRSLNIVTNSIDVSCILAKSDNQVICSGGLLQGKHMCFVGPEAQMFFSKIEVDIAFMGASGVRLGAGFTTSSPLQYDTKRAIMSAAKKRYVLMDSSKLHSSHLYAFADFSEINALITNVPRNAPEAEEMLHALESAGVTIIRVP